MINTWWTKNCQENCLECDKNEVAECLAVKVYISGRPQISKNVFDLTVYIESGNLISEQMTASFSNSDSKRFFSAKSFSHCLKTEQLVIRTE